MNNELNFEDALDEEIARENIRQIKGDLSGTGADGAFYRSKDHISAIVTDRELRGLKQKNAVKIDALAAYYCCPTDMTTAPPMLAAKFEADKKRFVTARSMNLDRLIAAVEGGAENLSELSDALHIPEERILEGFSILNTKYGGSVRHGGYMVFFDPFRVRALAELEEETDG